MQIRKDDVNNRWTVEFNSASVELLPDPESERVKYYVLNADGTKVFADWFPSYKQALEECWHYFTRGYWSWEADEE